tara:strand:+ start:324 stop:836 length:513 start_codon:yes stop_codon:yes gene_type:complete
MENWDKYSKEHYLFMLTQAEKHLNAQVDVLNSVQSRGQLQSIFSVTAITYFVNQILSDEKMYSISFSIAFLVILIIAAAFSLFGIFSYKVYYTGSSTEDLMRDVFYPFDNTKDNEISMLHSECENYAKRIKNNEITSTKKVKMVTRGFILLCGSPIFSLLFSLLYELYQG